MWFKESSSYFCKTENFGYGEINERSFSNPTPGDGIGRPVILLEYFCPNTKRVKGNLSMTSHKTEVIPLIMQYGLFTEEVNPG